MILRYGAVGYAVYFHCLELIAADISETNLTFELEHDSEIIADDLKILGDPNRSAISLVEDIMRYIIELRLFEESEGRIFCFKLLKRLDSSMTSNPAFRAMIAEAHGKNHDRVMTESCKTRLDKTRLDKTRLDKTRLEKTNIRDTPQNFTPPTVEEVQAYCKERNNSVNSRRFVDFYASKGWMIGKNKMKDWRAAVRTWEQNSSGDHGPELATEDIIIPTF